MTWSPTCTARFMDSGLVRFHPYIHRKIYPQTLIRLPERQSANEIFDAVPRIHEAYPGPGIKERKRHVQRGNTRNLDE